MVRGFVSLEHEGMEFHSRVGAKQIDSGYAVPADNGCHYLSAGSQPF